MTRLIIIFLLLNLNYELAVASDNCGEVKYSSGHNDSRPLKNTPELVRAQGPLLIGGKIICKMSTNYQSLPLTNEILRIESGEYMGVKYRFHYSDGSGTVQGLEGNNLDILTDPANTNWIIICKADGMDDTAWCAIQKDNISVTVWKDGSPLVSVGNYHFPGTSYSLRVDGMEVFEAKENKGFSRAETSKIIEQLNNGNSVLTRYVEWPYENYVDKRTDLFGLSLAYKLAKVIRDNIAN